MTKLIRATTSSYRMHGYTTCRHLHATTLLLSGVPVHVVAARLGHADPAITLRVYAHVIRTAEAAARHLRPGRKAARKPAVSKPVSKRAPSKIGRGL